MPRVEALPTRFLAQIPRAAIAESQRHLAQAQTEATTGRHADIGLTLGARTGSAIGLRLEQDTIATALDLAGQAKARAEITQTSLTGLTQLAQGFQSMLAGARSADNGKELASITAASSLEALRTTLSTTYDGQFIFAGLNSEQAPLAAYEQGPRDEIVTAFVAAFGFAPTDPAAASLTGGQISDFLENGFANLFADPAWSDSWSAAADANPRFRLHSGEALDLSTNANQPFARTLARAFAMVEVMGSSAIGREAFQSVADDALTLVTEAQLQIGAEQARIGTGESRLKEAVDGLRASSGRISSAVSALEAVDPYGATSRLNLLMTQLETSYALTGRISRMSLLSYI